MRPARYARLKEIVLAARDLTGSERRTLLDRECGDDRELRQEVDRLLAYEERAPSVLRTGGPVSMLPPEAGGERLPERIAEYRVLELLGVGGMGVVYRAEQTGPIRREVAIKCIRQGMRTDGVIARFRGERQTLARMDHPNIARVFDAGADDDGHPFFVMELVRGRPITDFCQSLAVRARLDLFRSVCHAVDHAHRRGVIHRDLKPSNVLVVEGDSGPVPKVIDFGIARAVEGNDGGEAPATESGGAIGTPQYMSPEQAAGRAAPDTRSDVYSLGVILYEVLTGALPYDADRSTLAESLRVVLEEPAATLRSRWPAGPRPAPDLETIVAKALRKEPDERYASASALADDVGRFLRGHPVLAHPPSTAYQIRKLASRHRAAAAFTAVALLMLVVFAAGMSFLYGAQRDERLRAETEARKSERIRAFLQEMLASADPAVARGENVTVRQVLDAASVRADSALAADPEVRAAVRATIGNTYRSLGLLPEAEEHFRSALADVRARYGDGPETARALRELAVAVLDRGDPEQAEALDREALAICRARPGESEAELAGVLDHLGVVRFSVGDLEGATELLEEALAIRRRVLGELHEDTAVTVGNLAVMIAERGDDAGAEPYFRETHRVLAGRLGSDHPDVAVAAQNLAVNLKRQDRLEEAEALYREALRIQRAVVGDEHPDVAQTLQNLALLLGRRGEWNEAESAAREALAVRREALGTHPLTAAAMESLANILSTAAGDGANGEVEALIRECLRMREQLFPGSHWMVGRTRVRLAAELSRRARPEEAEPLLESGAHAVVESDASEAVRRWAVEQAASFYERHGRDADAARWRAREAELGTAAAAD